ncbi:eukaryotic translation initiation factor 3 subunit J isoform X2 [Hydra vulgaris]|uniref:Eukaryotic translation initiation factor 3 subunit J n=1 Tax=Hydra vulgaris TaxID=6087 RepID=A0ABM4DDK0_HYDVU
MAAWDDDDFVPIPATSVENVIAKSIFDGEDEDDEGLKDNWDDEDKEKEKKTEVPVTVPKKKKPLAEKIKEKEEKRKQELLAKQKELEAMAESNKELSAEEQLSERIKNQRLQEESDLELAKEAFGVSDIPGVKTIDNFDPTTKDEFNELSTMIVKKFSKYEDKSEYPVFLETLFRDCCAGVDVEDIKRISNSLSIVATEKLKLTKVTKSGKKKGASKKDTIKVGKGLKNDMDYGNDDYYEYEDFI